MKSLFINLETKKKPNTREVCWRLDKVGPVGETILHIALIKGQNDISKKLLQHFPKMVNDFYVGSEYFGSYFKHNK